MKVAHNDDFDTHAVVGGRRPVKFAIAQTAEFFTVLSSTLYTNKPLAVAREVLCNGWDSHIVSGRQAIPIQVTLNETKLVIRDFGSGIDPDKIQDIYCTYGASTKTHDGNQTGGFGLGSKAPFAYSDHFTVTNHFNGTKTVYAASRGSAQSNGEPDMRVMVAVPTTETGVEVQLPIKKPEDVRVFREYIETIAKYGEMNIVLNDNPILTIPIGSAENNIYLTSEKLASGPSPIHLRYGNVVYPVPPHDEYQTLYDDISKKIENMRYQYSDSQYSDKGPSWYMICQAQPNTISVVPSREALSLTETTINTVKDILTNVKKHFETDVLFKMEDYFKAEDTWIDEQWSKGTPERIFMRKVDNPIVDNRIPKVINTKEGLRDYIRKYVRQTDEIKAILDNYRIKSLIKRNYPTKKKLNRILQAGVSNYSNKKSDFINKILFHDIIRGLHKEEGLTPKQLWLSNVKSYYQKDKFKRPLEKHNFSLKDQLSILRNIVVIGESKQSVADSYRSYKDLNKYLSKYPVLVYIAPKNPIQRAKVFDFFKKRKMIILDLTEELPEKIPYVKSTGPKLVKPVVPKGIFRMDQMVSGTYASFNTHSHINNWVINPIRIEKPEFVFKPYDISSRHGKKFFQFGDDHAGLICHMFGDRGGVCVSDTQVEAYKKRGAIDGYDYIVKKVFDYLHTNDRIKHHLRMQKEQGERNRSIAMDRLVTMCSINPLINSKVGVTFNSNLTDEDKNYLKLYEMLIGWGRTNSETWRKTIHEENEKFLKWDGNPLLDNVQKIIENSSAFRFLDHDRMIQTLKGKPSLKVRLFIEMTVIHSLNI